MASLFKTLTHTTRLLWQPSPLLRQPIHTATKTVTIGNNRLCFLSKFQELSITKRCASYDSYPDYNTPSPYKTPKKYNFGYQYKYHKEGLLPRPKGHFENEPLPMKVIHPSKRDAWTREKALFGQNDYIDILGDGTIHPSELMEGPSWLRAYRGTEFQRLLRRMEFDGKRLKAVEPDKYHSICKRLFYLYKKDNKRRHAPFWGSRRKAAKSRIDVVRKDF